MYRQAQELEEEALNIYLDINNFRAYQIPENILDKFAQTIGLPDAKLPSILSKTKQV